MRVDTGVGLYESVIFRFAITSLPDMSITTWTLAIINLCGMRKRDIFMSDEFKKNKYENRFFKIRSRNAHRSI